MRFFEAIALGAIFWLLYFAVLGRLWIVLFSAIPIACVWPLEVWLRINNGTPINQHLVALAWESNWAEGGNFFSAYGTGLVILVATWSLFYGLSIWLAYQNKLVWMHRSRWWCVALFIPLIFLLSYVNESSEVADNHSQSILEAMNDRGVSGWGAQWVDVFPVNLLLSVRHFHEQRAKLQAIRTVMEERTLNARQSLLLPPPDTVVLVIGESASAKRWGLLGYGRDTTPRLAKVSGLVAFSDVVALSTATRTAVPGVLARRPILDPSGRPNANAEPSLVKAFAEAGYQTHWLSNQSPLGQHDTSISVYAKEAADLRFLNPATYQHRTSYDENLLPPLHAILSKPGAHFIVLHLLGSHFDYGMRYPSAYDFFKPSLQSVPAGITAGEAKDVQTENSYDNSLLYTDHVLDEIVTSVKLRGGRSVVAYFSDHGVDAVKGACASKGVSRRSEAAFRVPAFIWLNEEMRYRNPDQWRELMRNVNMPYTTRAIFSTLLELAGVEIDGGLPSENFLNKPESSFGGRQVSIGNGQVTDFDAAVRKNPCFISGH